MTSIDNFHITPEQEELFNKSCIVRSGFWGTKVDKKFMVWRRRNFGNLIDQNVIPDIAVRWNALTDQQRLDWTNAGYYADMSGWDLFATDTSYRVVHNITGLGEPNFYHQYFVGAVHILTPASAIIIQQNYILSTIIPIDFGFNFCSKLVSVGAGSYAIWITRIYFDYDTGDGIEHIVWDYECDVSSSWWWEYYSDVFNELDSFNIRIEFRIEVYNMRGSLYIDGVELIYNDQNYAIDKQCNDIFSNWIRTSYPSGCLIESLYSRNSFYQ